MIAIEEIQTVKLANAQELAIARAIMVMIDFHAEPEDIRNEEARERRLEQRKQRTQFARVRLCL